MFLSESFIQMDNTPSSHQFLRYGCVPENQRAFNSAVMKDMRLMRSHLPPGIIVKTFSDRLVKFFLSSPYVNVLLSVMYDKVCWYQSLKL